MKVMYRILAGIILVAVVLLLVRGCKGTVPRVDPNKKSIVELDTLVHLGGGEYRRIINDLATQKEMVAALKRRNNALGEQLVSVEGKLINALYSANIQPSDTVIITKEVFIDTSGNNPINIVSKYPSNTNPFITNDVTFGGGKPTINRWTFSDLKIDIAVVEDSKGIYSARLSAPSWLRVNKLDVLSLPLTPSTPEVIEKTPRYFNILLGAGVTDILGGVKPHAALGLKLGRNTIYGSSTITGDINISYLGTIFGGK